MLFILFGREVLSMGLGEWGKQHITEWFFIHRSSAPGMVYTVVQLTGTWDANVSKASMAFRAHTLQRTSTSGSEIFLIVFIIGLETTRRFQKSQWGYTCIHKLGARYARGSLWMYNRSSPARWASDEIQPWLWQINIVTNSLFHIFFHCDCNLQCVGIPISS